MIKNIRADISPSVIQDMVAVGATLYFAASDGIHGVELWKLDNTTGIAAMVKDIRPGGSSGLDGRFSNLTAIGNSLYFEANDGLNGAELWQSDGTTAGTSMLANINPGASAGSTVRNLTVLGTTLYFTANDGTNGYELWKLDTTTGIAAIVKDIHPGVVGSNPFELVVMGGILYFTASDGTNGVELWKSDGTALGTDIVQNINLGAASSSPSSLTVVGTMLYFSATNSASDTELWKSDGTAAGTSMVANINPGGASSSLPEQLTAIDTTLYFTANDGSNGRELWKSDGTAGGTTMVKDIDLGVTGIGPVSLVASANLLYFVADDSVNGAELWKSDGTTTGTAMVKDIHTGSLPGYYGYYHWLTGYYVSLLVVDNTLFFAATDGSNGVELWQSDGTEAGTLMVADINPGVASSSPGNLTVAGGKLFFTAINDDVDFDLWALDLPTSNVPSSSGGGCVTPVANRLQLIVLLPMLGLILAGMALIRRHKRNKPIDTLNKEASSFI